MLRTLLLVQLLFTPAIICKQKKGKLVSVVVIFRDGDQTPLDPYPTDPYRNVSYWPVGFGQLTNLGKLQEFQLGQWLRNRYNGFLPEEYCKHDVYVSSIRDDRTLASAQANLAGLFPPRGNQVWNKDLPWQPIPVHTSMQEAMSNHCDRYHYLLDDLYMTPPFKRFMDHYQNLFAYLSEKSDAPISNWRSLQNIYDNLLIETLYNLTLPEWTKEIFPDKLRKAAEISFLIPCFTQELARYKVGPLHHDILLRFDKAKHSKVPKFVMYSGNASTIANVLNSLEAFEPHRPPYAAAILFELHKAERSHYVKILYKHDDVLEKLILKNCIHECPLDTFKQLLEPVRLSPRQFNKECKLTFSETVPSTVFNNPHFIVGMIALLMFSTTALCMALFKKHEKTDHNVLINTVRQRVGEEEEEENCNQEQYNAGPSRIDSIRLYKM